MQGDLLAVGLVGEDVEHRLPHLVAGLIVRGAGLGRREGLSPVLPAQPELSPRRLDEKGLRRRLLVEADGRLDRIDHATVGLEARDSGVGLDGSGRALRDEVAQRAGLHAVFAEAREHILDVREVRRTRTDEQHAAAALPEVRIRVDQIGGAVQRDHRLAGPGSAVDDESAPRSGADDRVLVGLDRPEHVPHAR